jgi:hypothetical protein
MQARAGAVEATRSRILGAAMELHAERGAVATSWEDIHRVVTPEHAELIFAGATTPWERLRRYIASTCECYARGDGWLHAARREADLERGGES